MLRSIRRRLARVEESLPLPMTAERFMARTHQLAMRTGRSLGDSMDKLIKNLSDKELESLIPEVEQMAFGSDTAARDAAKREVLAATGYPVWNLADEVSREEGW